jgi:hypothetical protein
MLQDFLAGRPTIEGKGRPRTAPTTRDENFQPLFGANARELGGSPAPRQIGRIPEPEPERLEAPQIELVEERGQVRRIIVTCKCCERIEIECEY